MASGSEDTEMTKQAVRGFYDEEVQGWIDYVIGNGIPGAVGCREMGDGMWYIYIRYDNGQENKFYSPDQLKAWVGRFR
jgi:hypothetical protein